MRPPIPRLLSDAADMDRAWIYRTVSGHYWAKGRTRAEQDALMDCCHNFGIQVGEEQIAYARVLTDGLTLAYVFDVVVAKAQQRQGYGKWLMARLLEYPEFRNVRTWMLATDDAHSLYAQFGFRPIVEGLPLMVRQHNWLSK